MKVIVIVAVIFQGIFASEKVGPVIRLPPNFRFDNRNLQMLMPGSSIEYVPEEIVSYQSETIPAYLIPRGPEAVQVIQQKPPPRKAPEEYFFIQNNPRPKESTPHEHKVRVDVSEVPAGSVGGMATPIQPQAAGIVQDRPMVPCLCPDPYFLYQTQGASGTQPQANRPQMLYSQQGIAGMEVYMRPRS